MISAANASLMRGPSTATTSSRERSDMQTSLTTVVPILSTSNFRLSRRSELLRNYAPDDVDVTLARTAKANASVAGKACEQGILGTEYSVTGTIGGRHER